MQSGKGEHVKDLPYNYFIIKLHCIKINIAKNLPPFISMFKWNLNYREVFLCLGPDTVFIFNVHKIIKMNQTTYVS